MRAVLSAVVIAVATLWPAAAEADLVRLANGATLSVKSATLDGDTMVVMQAVLDTQFWLATHVVCITLGYSATFAAGALGLIYIGCRLFTSALDQPDSPICGTAASALLTQCSDKLEDDLFGLHLADHQSADVYGLVSVLARAAPTLLIGLERVIELLPLLHSPGADAESGRDLLVPRLWDGKLLRPGVRRVGCRPTLWQVPHHHRALARVLRRARSARF